MNDSSSNYTTIVSTQVIKALELTDDNELSPKQIVKYCDEALELSNLN